MQCAQWTVSVGPVSRRARIQALAFSAFLFLGACNSDNEDPKESVNGASVDGADGRSSVALPGPGDAILEPNADGRSDSPALDVALQRIADDCRAYRYEKALAACDDLLASTQGAQVPGASPSIDVALYVDMVRREAEQFRVVDERLKTGQRAGFLSYIASDHPRAIIGVSEQGILLKDAPGDSGGDPLCPWPCLADSMEFTLMSDVGSDITAPSERLALAIFAQHRGLTSARDTELRATMALASNRDAQELQDALARIAEAIERVPVGAPQGPTEDARGHGAMNSESANERDIGAASVF